MILELSPGKLSASQFKITFFANNIAQWHSRVSKTSWRRLVGRRRKPIRPLKEGRVMLNAGVPVSGPQGSRGEGAEHGTGLRNRQPDRLPEKEGGALMQTFAEML